MNLPKRHYKSYLVRWFVPLTIDGYNYTAEISCSPGSMQTPEDPASDPQVEVYRLFDVSGLDISKEVSEEDWNELYDFFNGDMSKHPHIQLLKVDLDTPDSEYDKVTLSIS